MSGDNMVDRGDRRRTALFSALLATSTALVGFNATPAYAQSEQTSQRQFNIPAQSVREALLIFSQQSDIQVTAQGPLVEGKTSTAISGQMAPAQALSSLLTGTGLTFRFIGSNAVRIELAPQASGDGAIQLGPVRVEGSSGASASGYAPSSSDSTSTENTRSYAASAVTIGRKSPVAPKDVPQSISIVTRERLNDQNLTTLTQAMERVPGITVKRLTSNGQTDGYVSRGSEIVNVQFDGGAPTQKNGAAAAYGAIGSFDTAIFDHIEVLRGADGMFGGNGDPSGTINLVRKRGLSEPQIKMALSAGSWDNYRGELDVTGPLTTNGAVRGRLVAAYEDRNFFNRITRSQKRLTIFGTFDVDLSPTTLLVTGASYSHLGGGAGDLGLPRYNDGTDAKLPRRTNLGYDWGTLDRSTKEIFGRIEQDIGERWLFKASATYYETSLHDVTGYATGAISKATGLGPYLDGREYEDFTTAGTLLDTNLSGSFDLFGQEQHVTIGADWRHVDENGYKLYYVSGVSGIDVWNFDPYSVQKPQRRAYANFYTPIKEIKQWGVYGTLRLKPVERLSIVAGGRISNYNNRQDYVGYTATGDVLYSGSSRLKDSGIIIPYGAVIYELTKNWNVYGSYTRSFVVQASLLTADGEPLGPEKGRNWEVGIKGDLLDGKLNVAVAYYDILRNNRAIYIADGSGGFGTFCCYIGGARSASSGIDAEVTGEILPGWSISAGYTYNKNDFDDGDQPYPYSSLLPRHMFKLWTTWQPRGALSKFKFGGGVHAQSSSFQRGTVAVLDPQNLPTGDFTPYQFHQAGYSVWDASIDYSINENWSANVLIGNIFDKTYYRTVGTSSYGNFYGEPRNVMFTLRAKY